jgi:hypothetical protein
LRIGACTGEENSKNKESLFHMILLALITPVIV